MKNCAFQLLGKIVLKEDLIFYTSAFGGKCHQVSF